LDSPNAAPAPRNESHHAATTWQAPISRRCSVPAPSEHSHIASHAHLFLLLIPSFGSPPATVYLLRKRQYALSVAFAPDLTLPAGFQVIRPNDYRGSGFDRGHLCPAADRSAWRADMDAFDPPARPLGKSLPALDQARPGSFISCCPGALSAPRNKGSIHTDESNEPRPREAAAGQ